MTRLNRREILGVIAAVSALSAVPAFGQPAPTIDLAAGQAIGRAWLSAHPEAKVGDLRKSHLPEGINPTALKRLRSRAASDFRHGRIFVHDGWTLSETEAQLFALLT
jgi:hypothetical protein